MRMIVAIMMIAATCRAAPFHSGWTTNAWPSQDYWRSGDVQDWDMQRAVLERYEAARTCGHSGLPSIDALRDDIAWFRYEDVNLWLVKTYMKAVLTAYVNVDLVGRNTLLSYLQEVGDQTNLVDYSVNAYYSKVPTWSVTGLCVAVGAPTNYFDYVPWKGIKGVGPFTDDADSPHAHGWTNSVTVKGGTPPGPRLRWYTTDYGKQHIPYMLDKLWLIQNRQTFVEDGGVTFQSEYGGTWNPSGATNAEPLRMNILASTNYLQTDYTWDMGSDLYTGASTVSTDDSEWSALVTRIQNLYNPVGSGATPYAGPRAFFEQSGGWIGDIYALDATYNYAATNEGWSAQSVFVAGNMAVRKTTWYTRVAIWSNTPVADCKVFVWFEPLHSAITNLGTSYLEEPSTYPFQKYDSIHIQYDNLEGTWFNNTSSNRWFELEVNSTFSAVGASPVLTSVPLVVVGPIDEEFDPDSYEFMLIPCEAHSMDITIESTNTYPRITTWRRTRNFRGWDLDRYPAAVQEWPWDTEDGRTGYRHQQGNRVITLLDFRTGLTYWAVSP